MTILASSLAFGGPVRALILSGQNNHDWRTTTPCLKQLLLESGRFDVRVNEEPAGLTARTLANYDVIVVDYQGPRWGEASEQAVLDFVRSGKGLVAVHGADYSFSGLDVLGDNHLRTGRFEPPWQEYIRMIGGTWAETEPKTGHGARHTFTVKFVDRDHPVTRGLPPSFRTNDELYHNIRTEPNIHVLATAFDDPKIRGTGKDEPILWTVSYGKGRVFHTVLGHDVAAMQETGFAQTFQRGAEWAGTGEVATATVPAIQPIRIRVVTGGHDHDPGFEAMFHNYPGLSVNVAPHPGSFAGDLKKDYDVLVLYDLNQQVPEGERNNLVGFLESGKGLVVLHHAIADFNDWKWWYEEVVGGRYLLKADGGMPASTYLHDQELNVWSVEKHPITAGVETLHLRDETYKGMWISPRAKVLMKTDHPTSDGPLVWIGPYEKSRVVYIELGHDHFAHEHTGYQRLVGNAIRWAAGRE